MILYVSGRDTDELLMVLEGISGVVVKRSDERKKRKEFERGVRSDSMGSASAVIFVGREAELVREVVVEVMRVREIELSIKGNTDTEASFCGPLDDLTSLSLASKLT